MEGWLQEVLSEEFHIDAQDGSPEQVSRRQPGSWWWTGGWLPMFFTRLYPALHLMLLCSVAAALSSSAAFQMGRLLCTLYTDVFKNKDFAGLHKMIRSQTDVGRRLVEARRIGAAESDRHNRLMELENEVDSDFEEGDEDAEDGDASAAIGGLAVSSGAQAEPEPVEEKTAEQLADEADGWETVPKKAGKKGGKK